MRRHARILWARTGVLPMRCRGAGKIVYVKGEDQGGGLGRQSHAVPAPPPERARDGCFAGQHLLAIAKQSLGKTMGEVTREKLLALAFK